ncbi:hypothetical protein QQ045_001324 [Rhodiola kirilowii]
MLRSGHFCFRLVTIKLFSFLFSSVPVLLVTIKLFSFLFSSVPVLLADDTIKLDLETNKIIVFIKFDVGNVVIVGFLKNIDEHKGSFETVHIQDATGHEFATRLGNVFTLGKGTKPCVSPSQGQKY